MPDTKSKETIIFNNAMINTYSCIIDFTSSYKSTPLYKEGFSAVSTGSPSLTYYYFELNLYIEPYYYQRVNQCLQHLLDLRYYGPSETCTQPGKEPSPLPEGSILVSVEETKLSPEEAKKYNFTLSEDWKMAWKISESTNAITKTTYTKRVETYLIPMPNITITQKDIDAAPISLSFSDDYSHKAYEAFYEYSDAIFYYQDVTPPILAELIVTAGVEQ